MKTIKERIAYIEEQSKEDLQQIVSDAEHFRAVTRKYEAEIAISVIKELQQELKELKKDKWELIKSAPKDGTEILCFEDRMGIGQMVLYYRDGYWREKCNGLGLKNIPTHWQPLGIPPKEKEDKIINLED